MRLLFDQNLSFRLLELLADVYPDAEHVRNVGLADATDTEIWDYALSQGFVIVSKDADFRQRAFVLGSPPKVVWIRLGNCTTQDIEELLRDRTHEVREFVAHSQAAFLALG